MSKKNKQGIVIGTKDEALWTKLKKATEERIKNIEDSLIIERALVKLAEEKILLEKRK